MADGSRVQALLVDDKMMKAGGAAKREELIKAFGGLSISKANVRDYTKHEQAIINKGDKD